MLQHNIFNNKITLIDQTTGREIGEVNGCELRIYARGIIHYSTHEEAVNKAKELRLYFKPENTIPNTNQILLF